MIPKHYSLKSESPHAYEIHDGRDGKTFQIAKHGLSLDMHGELSKIQRFNEGGTALLASNKYDSPDQILNETGVEPEQPQQPEPSMLKQGGQFAGEMLRQQAAFPIGIMKGVAHGVGAALAPIGEVGAGVLSGLTGEEPQPEAPVQPAEPAPARTSPEAPALATTAAANPFADQAAASTASLEKYKEALEGGVAAEAKAGKQTAKAYADFDKEQQVTLDQLHQTMNGRKAADTRLLQSFMDKTVDPDRYWSSKNTGQKISTGIGMILGGLGAGVGGGPNYAMDYINKAIERDMDAQKNDQSKAMNLWKMNREATQDDLQASLAFQNQALTAVKAKVLAYQSEAAGPLAKERGAQVLNQIDQMQNQNNFRRSLLSSSQGGQLLAFDPSHLLNTIPEKDRAEAAKEISNAQKMKALHDSVEQNVLDLKSKFMNGLLSPHDRESAIDSFASQMDVLSDHRFNLEASKLKGHAFFPSPTDGADTIRNKDRRREEFFRDQLQSPVFKGAVGVGLDRFAATSIPQRAQEPVERVDRSGRVGLFNPQTKQFIGYKQ